jgi:hypothetical protein
MEAMFGNALATGRYALGSGEALGQNQTDSAPIKVEGPPLTPTQKAPTATVEGSKATKVVPSTASGKRKREISLRKRY